MRPFTRSIIELFDGNIDQMAREMQREESVNKLGNLTLLTQKLNSSVSNGPFATKLPAVKAHAALTINRDLHAYDHWDERAILQRGSALFDLARVIWPAPASPAAPSAATPQSDAPAPVA